MASGNTSSSAEIFSNGSKEVASSFREEVEVCEELASQVAETAASSNFTT